MAMQSVILVEIGQPTWPRFMIFHSEKKRYWDQGRWVKKRKQGELWHRKTTAQKELQFVRLASPDGK